VKQVIDPTGENSNHKVAAVFDDADDAFDAHRELLDRMPLEREQIDIIAPEEKRIGRRLLPDSAGIWHTVIRSHLVLGLAGMLAGIVLFFGLLAADVQFIQANPFFGAYALVHVSFLLSLLVAGALALRPDQLPWIWTARTAWRAGRHVLVAHARSTDEMNDIRAFIPGSRSGVAQTL
jgi:hypothetical protein